MRGPVDQKRQSPMKIWILADMRQRLVFSFLVIKIGERSLEEACMVTCLIVVLVHRAARDDADDAAFILAWLCWRLCSQILESGLEHVQSLLAQRLPHQGNRAIELAIVIGADALK